MKTCKNCKKEHKGRGKFFCSIRCRSDYIKQHPLEYPSKNKGRKQSKETIAKRIQATDQHKKEETRRRTMLEKYGVTYCSQIPEVAEKISQASRGSKKLRTKEHQDKIVQSKKQNKSNKHRPETKQKISESLSSYYQYGEDQCCTLTKNPTNGRGHVSGYFNGILYRSSYELSFLVFCDKHNIKVVSAESKEYRVRYKYDNKKRWYYPDFFLPELDICIEIKPASMVDDMVREKIKAAQDYYDTFLLITEVELSNDSYLLDFLRQT